MKYKKKPDWLKMPSRGAEEAARIRAVLLKYSLDTVCRQARCPNLGYCYQHGTATFLILGNVCTRSCRYCAIGSAAEKPDPLHPDEPERVAKAAAEMKLSYVVITSVTRDDLPDGGGGHFARTVKALRDKIEGVKIEVLTPDFNGNNAALETVAEAEPDVFNHNLETVEKLFSAVRPGTSYNLSLSILDRYGKLSPSTPLKSGLMLGLGEQDDDIRKAIHDLRSSGVTMLTLGQYLQPSRRHWPVDRYVIPEEFDNWRNFALSEGFNSVASGPLVRSSFHAELNYSSEAVGSVSL
ncbi:MAG: lipoyl synthase [Candidatus Aegiribacteria sp.]|nr:lipoyl synthase [Candidatus Aegiribacteria sp.]